MATRVLRDVETTIEAGSLVHQEIEKSFVCFPLKLRHNVVSY